MRIKLLSPFDIVYGILSRTSGIALLKRTSVWNPEQTSYCRRLNNTRCLLTSGHRWLLAHLVLTICVVARNMNFWHQQIQKTLEKKIVFLNKIGNFKSSSATQIQ